jgi:hypothetical protein
MRFPAILAATCFASTQVLAACPDSPPKIDWNLHSDDQRIDAGYLKDLLAGNKVKFNFGGTEHYRKSGKYRYSDAGQTYDADTFRFYKNGVRCIGYGQPRFDLYVVNNGKLLLVNVVGGRYEAKVR